MADEDDSYEVGYRKPPKHTRFTKGQSGNPQGRPKGAKSLSTILGEVGRQKVRINTDKGSRYITKLEAAATQQANMAITGKNRQAIRDFLQWQRISEESTTSNAAPAAPDERDTEVMKNMIKRIREHNDAPVEAESKREEKEKP